MPPVKYSSITALEDNSMEIYMNCTEVLLRIARNILNEPNNPKYRSISLGSNVVTSKLLPASGAMQCLFEMGFQEVGDHSRSSNCFLNSKVKIVKILNYGK